MQVESLNITYLDNGFLIYSPCGSLLPAPLAVSFLFSSKMHFIKWDILKDGGCWLIFRSFAEGQEQEDEAALKTGKKPKLVASFAKLDDFF